MSTRRSAVPCSPKASIVSIGQALPVRITKTELIVYDAKIEEVACHRLFPRGPIGQRAEHKAHRPSADPRQRKTCRANASPNRFHRPTVMHLRLR